jgi:hypothetical protein
MNGQNFEPESQTHIAIIDQVIKLCDFPSDSILVKYIDQQQWSQLVHIVGLEEVDEFYTVRDDGITFESTRMLVHLRRFKVFLLCYKNKTCWGDSLTEDDVMLWTPKDFSQYCCTKAYHHDYAAAFPTPPLNLPQRAGSSDSIRGTRNGSGASIMTHSVTIHEIHRGIKKEGTCYQDTKDYNTLNEWNEHVVEATQIDCTHSAFNALNIPKDDSKKTVVQKIQALYAILKECLNMQSQ